MVLFLFFGIRQRIAFRTGDIGSGLELWSRGGAIRPKQEQSQGDGRPGSQRRQALGSCVWGLVCCRLDGCSVYIHTVGSGSAILIDDYILKKDEAVVTVFCL